MSLVRFKHSKLSSGKEKNIQKLFFNIWKFKFPANNAMQDERMLTVLPVKQKKIIENPHNLGF